ncbi:MAG: heavy-metal-associated domain-containing protein [Pseudonocardiaceae bacterium]
MKVQATYAVAGMKCGGCANRVRGELAKLTGFIEVDIDPKGGIVRLVSADPLPEPSVCAAVQAAGYRFEGAR